MTHLFMILCMPSLFASNDDTLLVKGPRSVEKGKCTQSRSGRVSNAQLLGIDKLRDISRFLSFQLSQYISTQKESIDVALHPRAVLV